MHGGVQKTLKVIPDAAPVDPGIHHVMNMFFHLCFF